MNNLIEIKKDFVGNKSGVSARDLYLGLGLHKAHWSKWSKQNIENNEFFIENENWHGFTLEVNGNETKDYAITIDFAKHISMQAKTENSHKYRDYMIECEKPLTLEELSLQAIQGLTKKIEQQKRQIESKNQLIIASNEASIKAGEISVREFVKTNDAINIGSNKFLDWLRGNNIIMQHSRQPMQVYVDNGWLTWKFSKEEINGEKRRELKVTPRGQLQLAKKYLTYRTVKLESLENALMAS